MSDILIVDDERDIRELMADILRDEGFAVRLASQSDECLEAIKDQEPGLVILDIWLKDSAMDGIDILKHLKKSHKDVPVVIISGHGNIEIAVAAIKQGAYDFIEKPFNINQLLVVIRRAMEAAQLRRENKNLRTRDPRPGELIGDSVAFRNMVQMLERVTRANGRVLLTGPSGSGKDVAASYIYKQSPRSDSPFVTVSCATILADQMEEVLFGRETPEHGIIPGLLEQANGGVIYFDEVADMPLATQSKILRVLVDPRFTRVGGTTQISVDLRVISSTSKHLPTEIEAGRFRQELFSRLNVVPIAIPSLADRREDIPALVGFFTAYFQETQSLPRREFSQEALALLQSMDWPGNIRQLRNLVERVLILGEAGKEVSGDELHQEASQSPRNNGSVLAPNLAMLPLREAREAFEREYLTSQIQRFGGNISRTAQFVEMERSALHRKLKTLGISTASKAELIA